jgi:hypothetical protein
MSSIVNGSLRTGRFLLFVIQTAPIDFPVIKQNKPKQSSAGGIACHATQQTVSVGVTN